MQPGEPRRWLLGAALLSAVWLLAVTPARAVTYEEIPYDLRRRLPEFVLRIVPPRALAALSLEDLEEFANAYQSDKLRFVAEARVESHSGPLEPELALLLLQIPEGAPFIEERFVRLARRYYGNGIFSSLQWEVHSNVDGSVDILLWYASNEPKNIIPDVGIGGEPGILLGVQFYDAFFRQGDRQLTAGFQLSENYLDEPRVYASLVDNTLNGGDNGYSLSASVGNVWRTRRNGHPEAASLRERVARVDGGYSWIDRTEFGSRRVSLAAGLYSADVNVLAGDPTDGGAAPRSDFSHDGDAVYVSVAVSDSERDHLFTPKDGHSYTLRAEQHGGDFSFTRVSADARKYIPVHNVLGITEAEPDQFGGRNDIKRFTPPASLALQAQVSIAEGEVPYTEEVFVGGSTTVRGVTGSSIVGTHLLAARAEYRFAIDQARNRELYVFTDHALAGEGFAELESANSFGLGGLFRLPVYGGFKAGAYAARSYDGSSSSYGIALGYQF